MCAISLACNSRIASISYFNHVFQTWIYCWLDVFRRALKTSFEYGFRGHFLKTKKPLWISSESLVYGVQEYRNVTCSWKFPCFLNERLKISSFLSITKDSPDRICFAPAPKRFVMYVCDNHIENNGGSIWVEDIF